MCFTRKLLKQMMSAGVPLRARSAHFSNKIRPQFFASDVVKNHIKPCSEILSAVVLALSAPPSDQFQGESVSVPVDSNSTSQHIL
jgi:hypothetical protein